MDWVNPAGASAIRCREGLLRCLSLFRRWVPEKVGETDVVRFLCRKPVSLSAPNGGVRGENVAGIDPMLGAAGGGVKGDAPFGRRQVFDKFTEQGQAGPEPLGLPGGP